MKPSTFSQFQIPELYAEFRDGNRELDQAENEVDNFRDFVVDRVKPATMEGYKKDQPADRGNRFEYWQRLAFRVRALELIRTGENTVGPELIPWEFKELGYTAPDSWERLEEKEPSSKVSVVEWKGQPVINIEYGEYQGKKLSVRFGLTKAKAIYENRGEILDFIMAYSPDVEGSKTYNPEGE